MFHMTLKYQHVNKFLTLARHSSDSPAKIIYIPTFVKLFQLIFEKIDFFFGGLS